MQHWHAPCRALPDPSTAMPCRDCALDLFIKLNVLEPYVSDDPQRQQQLARYATKEGAALSPEGVRSLCCSLALLTSN